ncbi:MAG: hypothetical protein ACE5JQ_09635 [Candidatus Methylomirabilales bacterium]
MRMLMATIIGLLFLGTLGLQTGMAAQSRTADSTHEPVNIRVREVRRETQAQGLSIVYELENASVRRWGLRRVELHVFDRDDRRIGLVRPASALSYLERGDVEFVRARIPAQVVSEAHRLEVRLFVDKFTGYPVADPVPKRLVYAFPLKPQPTRARFQTTHARLLYGVGRLRVERAGMVEWEGSPRAIVLRLINRGRETLSDVVLKGEITGANGPLKQFRLLVMPKYLRHGPKRMFPSLSPSLSSTRQKEFRSRPFTSRQKKGSP